MRDSTPTEAALQTCALVDRFLIAIAGSASQQASEVVLWEKMRDPPAPRPDPAPPSAVIRPVYYSSKYWKHGLGTLAVLLTVLVAVWYQDSVIAPNVCIQSQPLVEVYN